MSFKTPQFWYARPQRISDILKAWTLWPLSILYRAGHVIDQVLARRQSIRVPVLCIGNVTAGGAGKTPSVIALLPRLKADNICRNPYIVMRGYGGAAKTPTLVDTGAHSAADVGDEALLLSAHAPVVVGQNRYDAAQLAAEHGADLIIMDDGLNNRSLAYDASIIVIDGMMGLGNGHMLPAGPLRTPPKPALEKAARVIVIGQEHQLPAIVVPFKHKTTFASASTIFKDEHRGAYVAFCGLGYPDKFFAMLRDHGVNVIKTCAYPDHHMYSAQDIQALKNTAHTLEARLITTEKDIVKISDEQRADIDIAKLDLCFDDETALADALKDALNIHS